MSFISILFIIIGAAATAVLFILLCVLACMVISGKESRKEESREDEKMITIENNDLPIEAAGKIIAGTKPRNENDATSFFLRAIFGDPNATREEALKNVDMFTLEEIEEIARYLLLYCETHKNGD